MKARHVRVVVWVLSMVAPFTAKADGPAGEPARGEEYPSLSATYASSNTRFSIDASGAWGVSDVFGGATDPRRGMLGLALRVHRPLVDHPGFRLDYTGGLVPVELAQGTRVGRPDGTGRETVFGAGLDVLGLTAHFRGGARWHPFVTARGGARLFTAPVPNPRGTRFNFSADVGGGLAFRVTPDRSLTLQMELHHLSNGGLGPANPSLNQLTVGVGIRGARRPVPEGAS